MKVSGTWVTVPDGSDFPITNLPYGAFCVRDSSRTNGDGGRRRIGVAIGEQILDLSAVAARGLIDEPSQMLRAESLNAFLASGRSEWDRVRARIIDLLSDASHRGAVEKMLIAQSDAEMCLPFEVADYVDFYASIDHAANVGALFRPDSPALPANWRHLPIGYHGRAGTVVVSGSDVVRPSGQRKPAGAEAPTYGPSQRLDIEAEVGFVVGTPSARGTQVGVGEVAEHVFGAVLLNDWSARDIQAWEYVPLGPFLGKSFATSISPWVVPLAALDAARVAGPVQDPEPLPYLRRAENWGIDLSLEVDCNGTVVSRPPFGSMYWTADQQLAHLTVNGASLRTGDLFASGTVSGPEPDQRGSFLELSWSGRDPITLDDGTTRSFLEDGDTVTLRATAPGAGGTRIGFGACTGTIRPAL
ncbi:MAG: fumarylacetoacetase [Geodermatophilaceae bacterium]|nr:fumarylacetoacetase [Geodermatophilaceae bacterium]